MLRLPIIGPAYGSQSPIADAEALLNFYIESIESPNAPDRNVAYPCPGLTLEFGLPSTPNRGTFTLNDRFFLAAGDTLYEIQSDGTRTALGTINVDTNPCTFASSGDISNQLLVSSGNHAYCFNLVTNVFADVLTGAVFVAFLNNFFVALDVATNTIHVSDFNDATTWPGGQDQQRSISGDRWKSMIADGQYLWLFGGQKTDVYQLAGSGNTVFVPVQGISINYGIGAPFSVALVNNAPEWVSLNENGRGMVLRVENFSPIKRSTFAVDFAISQYDMISDAVAFSYQDQGHSFYVLNFPSAAATWVDDAARGMEDGWHTRGFWDSGNMIEQAYRPQYHAYVFGKHYVGDRATGNVYSMNINVATDVDGNGIRRLRRTSPLRSELNRVFYGQMILNIETGLGLQVGQGADPQVMARWSNDGGKTWGNEHWHTAGRVGKYNTRVSWSNTGAAYQRVFEFVMTDPIPWRLIGGYVEAEVGNV